MNSVFRVIDANLNRVSEALRIIEELARFIQNNKVLTNQIKDLRHNINNTLSSEYPQLINSRDTIGDVGTDIANFSERKSVIDIIQANFKRAQQALRVLEEYSKLINTTNANVFEQSRYKLYSLEKTMHSEIMNIYKIKRLESSLLYLVTDRTGFKNEEKFLNTIALAIKGGVKILQLREKNTPTNEFISLAKIVKEICSHHDCIFIINDRVDIALAVNADGVHLGQEDMDLITARKILGDQVIIGNSTHKPEDALNAIKNGADYIGVGPVFATPTKPNRQAVGLEYVKWASENINIPFFAIGGINNDNINTVIESGAKQVAVVRALMKSENPEKDANKMLNQLNNNSIKGSIS